MKITGLTVLKLLLWLFVCVLIISANEFLTLNDTDEVTPQDQAVFKYREDFKQKKIHDPKKLREILYQQLNHKNIRVRMNAAEVLGELGGAGILEDLWNIYLSDGGPSIRISAIAGILNHDTPDGLPYLLQSLSDEHKDARRKSLYGVSIWGDASHLDILEKMFNEESEYLNRIAVAAVMYNFGDTEKAEYIKNVLLNEPGIDVRRYTAHLLQDYHIEIDSQIVVEALQTEQDPYVRIWLSALLVERGDQNALSYIKNVLSSSDVPALKSCAAQALNALCEREFAYPYLLDLLKAEDADVRERAVEDLVDFMEFPLLPVLGRVLKEDSSIIVREVAAWAMGERKEAAALPYLEPGLYDESAFVRTGVVAAIYKILTSEGKKPRNDRMCHSK